MYQKPKAHRTRQQALDDGRLIDVTKEAKQLGFPCPVAVSRALWESCLSEIPGSTGQGEHIAVQDLLAPLLPQLLDVAESSKPSFRHALYCPTYWITSLPLRVELIYRGPKLLSATVAFPGHPAQASQPQLPSSVLFQLGATLRSLEAVFRHADLKHLRLIQDEAARLIEQHPLHRELRRATSATEVKTPTGFSTEAYRAAVLDSLHHVLGRLLACGSQASALHNIQVSLDALRSPLSDLVHLTRDLLELIGVVRIDTENATIKYNPLDPLLIAFSGLLSLLERGQLRIPQDALSTIRLQLTLIKSHIPEEFLPYLGFLESRFESIQGQSRLGPLPAVSHPLKDTWH